MMQITDRKIVQYIFLLLGIIMLLKALYIGVLGAGLGGGTIFDLLYPVTSTTLLWVAMMLISISIIGFSFRKTPNLYVYLALFTVDIFVYGIDNLFTSLLLPSNIVILTIIYGIYFVNKRK